MTHSGTQGINLPALKQQIRTWATQAGFSQMRVSALPLHEQERLQAYWQDWLQTGQHGEMSFLAREPAKRWQPQSWHPDTTRVLSFAMNYVPAPARAAKSPAANDWRGGEVERLQDPGAAVVSVYARGRDYHKVLRARLSALARRIQAQSESKFLVRACVDSAPLAEIAWAAQSGIGWRGKHTLLLNRQAGSMFFLGELLINAALPIDEPTTQHCGSCSRCLQVCPTQAITAPYQLDARRCISYLTIEHRGAIPVAMRRLIGNRIFGCDDCQLFCPWNRFASPSVEQDFAPRHGLQNASLLALWSWSQADFLARTQGSALRRITYSQWQRNLAVALGNQLAQCHGQIAQAQQVRQALQSQANSQDLLVREHVLWALTSTPGAAPNA